jgi:hypothetical protein
MPYSGPNDSKLPDHVAELPIDDREKWVGTWNGVYDDCIEDGGSKDNCEEKAFVAANGTLRGLVRVIVASATRVKSFLIRRDDHPTGQLCPYQDCCHDLAIPNIGWWICEHCERVFYAADTDSDFEDYHCYRLEKMDEEPPAEIPIAEDLGASWATPTEENSMEESERGFLKKIRDLVDMFLTKTKNTDRAVALGDVWEAIWDQLFDDETGMINSWPLDIFVENNALFAVLAREGKLYRVDLNVAEDGVVTMLNETQVLHQFVPVNGEQRTTVFRQSDGRLRVVAVVCTAVMNRIGELDSTAMFDSFVEHIEETQEYPIVTFFHQGERSRLGQADFVARDEYTYIASYVFDDNEFGQAASRGMEANAEYFGHSIEFEALDAEMLEVADGITLPMYTRGVNTAITICGEAIAAALFTAVKSMQGVQRMDQKAKDELLKLFDGNAKLVDDFEEFVDDTNRTIVDENMVARALNLEDTEDNLEEELEDDVETEDEVETESEVEGETASEEVEETELETELEDEAEEETEELEEPVDENVADRSFVIDETVIEAISEQLADRDVSQFDAVSTTLNDVQALVEKLDRNMSGAFTKVHQDYETLMARVEELEKPQEDQNRNFVAQLPRQSQDRLIFRPSRDRGEPSGNGDSPTNLADKAASVVDKWQGHK